MNACFCNGIQNPPTWRVFLLEWVAVLRVEWVAGLVSLQVEGFDRYVHPITHISRLPELPRIAGAFYKDGDLLETQPDGFGAWLAVVPAGEETTALGNQAQHGVQGWHRFRDGLLVENEGGAPLVGLEHQVGG